MREFSNKNEKGEVGATKPQAASYAATSPPSLLRRSGDKSKRKEVNQNEKRSQTLQELLSNIL